MKYCLNKIKVRLFTQQMVENMIKGAKGSKVKVLFQGLHMTCVTFVSVYNLKIYILTTFVNITFYI
jgi:hypothetical protein